jgi:Rieske Fe-S protein
MTDSTDLPRLDRRRLLHGAAILGVAAPVLAACGSDDETTSATSPEPESSSPSTSKGDKPSGGGDQPALAATADVPVGGGVIVDAEKTVVTQPSEGEFKAFSAVCTHQGCVVSTVEDNEINCACHGSTFSAEDGSVVTGPATAPLSEVAVEVKGGDVVRS